MSLTVLEKLENLGLKDQYKILLQERSISVPEIDFMKLKLSDVIDRGIKVGERSILLTIIDDNPVLINHSVEMDELGENHTFHLCSENEVIRLTMGLIESNTPIVAMSSVLRVTEQDRVHDLPPSISMALYDKLPEFIQDITDRVGNIQHKITKGKTRGRSIPEDKWLEKLLPFIEKYDYVKTEDNCWVRLYRSSGYSPGK